MITHWCWCWWVQLFLTPVVRVISSQKFVVNARKSKALSIIRALHINTLHYKSIFLSDKYLNKNKDKDKYK